MRAFERLFSRARAWRRVLLPVLLTASAAVTCENPTGPVRRQIALALHPVFATAASGNFGGLSVDQARLVVVRGETDTLFSQAYQFSPDSAQIAARVSVMLDSTETLLVTVQLLSGGQAMFTGSEPVTVSMNGLVSGATVEVPLQYVGPGTQVATIAISPRDTGIALGGTVQYHLTAVDSSDAPDSLFYAAWSTSATANTINANALFRGGRTAGTYWVRAHTPTGIWDSTRVVISTQQPGVPAAVVKVTGDAQSVPAGTAVPVAPQVKVVDGFGTPVGGVAVTFAVTGGGGSVTGASTTTTSSGLASVGSWTLGATPGVNLLTATVSGLPVATFTATGLGGPTILLSVPSGLVGLGGQGNLALVKLSPAAPAGGLTVTVTSDSTQYLTVGTPGTIAFAAGDTLKSIPLTGVAVGVSVLHATATGYAAGSAIVAVVPNFILLQAPFAVGIGQSTPLSVQLVPAAPSNNFVVTLTSSDTTKVKLASATLTFSAGQSSASATVRGVAAGVVPVIATASGYGPGATVVTVLGTGVASTLRLFSGGNQNATPGTALPQPVVVAVSDSLGNGVAGFQVGFAVTSGGGSVSPVAVTTDSAGHAGTTWTLGAASGTQTITATAVGLAGSPLTISANAPAITTTTVTPHLDTLTAIRGTFTLVAQAKDSTGANATGAFTWVSRTPAAVTVNPLGLVTAVANGSSWVVATEAGGTKDSALIVVQQKLASITVTPSQRSLYLTTSLRFTARAVDGLGTPLPSDPAFTWSSTAPAVATVDTTGLVTGVGLGTAQIRAAAGAVTGVANVSILTPITRIAVAVDSGGSTGTDTATLPSLGVTRRYHAYAYDTLDVLMPAVTQFTWQSTNGSVAVVPNITSDTVTATTAANGVTTINATAQGFTSSPGARLTVAQVLSAIVLSPPASNPGDSIGVGGSVTLVARGQDANGRFISGGTFTYRSSAPSVATVDSVTGVVTGVTNGTTTVTATSGGITSNALTVTVSNSGPAIIAFGRDTLAVGRGSSVSVPILLSKPAAGNLIVKLTVQDTLANWSTVAVTIPAGSTAANAQLNGHSAGTTAVTASDSSGLGYTAGSAVVKVAANVKLASSSYAIDATDIVTTQVLLSDPSPAGGTYVTFSYSTPGIARVSPDPAFIPAGQLAADIQILAPGAGSTTITPSAIGVSGTGSSFTAYAPVLTPSTNSIMLGVGQYEPNGYVQTPTYTNTPVVVGLASSDTAVATVTPSVTVPSGSYYAYFTITAQGTGTATVTPSASGWTAAHSVAVTTTTPDVGICCANNGLFTTSPQQTVTVYSEDSLRGTHYRTNSLAVNLRSTDTTVIRLLDTVVTIQPGQYYYSGGRFVMGGQAGTAYIVASASGHRSDSALYTVGGAGLAFSFGASTPRVGAGQYDASYYVYTPNSVSSPLVVTLASSDSTILAVPATVTIPSGSYYAYFAARGKTPGSVTLSATATGFGSASGSYAVTTPTVLAGGTTTYNNFSPGSNLTVYSADTIRSTHYRSAPLVVSITSSDANVVTVDSASVTIDSGAYSNNHARMTPVGVGTAQITFAAAGQTVLDTLRITVNTPPVRFSFGTVTVGRRQHVSSNGTGMYVYTPDARGVAVPVTITQNRGVDTLTPQAPVIDSGLYYAYIDAYGLTNGTDTVTASATGYASSQAYITVTTPRLGVSGLPGTTTSTNPPIGINVYAEDSLGNGRYTNDTVVVHAVSSDPTVLQPGQAYFPILKNALYAATTVNVVGPGTASVTYSDSAGSGYLSVTTGTVTVTAPPLAFSTSTVTLGMRQNTGAQGIYVYAPNNVVDSLAVHLASTDTRVATVPDSVIIPAGSYYAYFTVSGQDTTATVNLDATATGYTQATTTVRVTKPVFVIGTATSAYTTSQAQVITIYAEDSVTGGTHFTNEPVVVSLQFLATGVATVDSPTVTIPAGQYTVNTPTWLPNPSPTPGTAVLQASDARSAFYHYNMGQVTLTVSEPSLGLSWGTQTLGIGQYYDNAYVTTSANTTTPIPVTFSHTGTAHTATEANATTTPVTGITIPTGTYYTYFRIEGTSAGTDTLVASATSPPHNPAVAYTTVGQGHIAVSGWPSSLTISGTDSVQVTLSTQDPSGGGRQVQDSTTFTLAPNANIQFVSGGANSTVITSVIVPASQSSVTFWVKGVTQGSGSATISNTNYVTFNTPTITVNP